MLGIASAAYFLFFFDSSIKIPDTLYVPGGRSESETFGVQQKNGTILSMATALLGGLAVATAKYLPKSFKWTKVKSD